MALNGKVAVVTGAAQGIGRGITEVLLENGAKVALLDVDETVGKSLKESLDKQYGKEQTLFLSCDVTSDQQLKVAFQKTIETFGGLDILCNNAGILNENLVEKMISINLTSVIKGSYLGLAHMNKLTGDRGGVIVNTASIAATKFRVVGFTRAMAAASAESGYGIRFNALCPAFAQTDLFTSIPDKLAHFSHLAEVTQKLVEHFGVLEVSQVAKSFLELVTDETKNGEALMVKTTGNEYATFPTLK
ncbi:hypothetical protein LDENG_00300010 [Lucifuga dentata]|nr:hypothetical protein LDENG_00300010 [Lucifuga dentata]